MSNPSSHNQPAPGVPPSSHTKKTDPFLNDLENIPPSFLNENEPASDATPTIISRNGIIEAGSLKADGSSLGDLHGRRLAHFELLEPIGVGGMAAVLRARDTQLDRSVALKILPPDMAAEPENVRRFHQEARAAAKLDHENIARVFYCGEDQKLHFIAFEFVEGQNLRTLMEKRGRLPVKEAVHYMLQIAAGLAHAAQRNVVHRDIKPSNIIITPDGRAKLVDMGLARSLETHGHQALTQSGVTLGTFDYISPEQALEPREADVRSDIYSLGCTFYHALTGRTPVPEGTAARKLQHHQHVLPVDPRQLNPAIPDSVAAILARMMAKDPRNRYQRPEHLVQHLLHVAQELHMPADTPHGLLYIDAPLPRPPQKRPGLMIGLALTGLVAALVVLSFAPGDGTGPGLWELSPPTASPNGPGTNPAGSASTNQDAKVHPIAGPSLISNEIQLREALAQTGNLDLKLNGEIDLGSSGLVIQGDRKQVFLKGGTGSPKGMTRLLLNYDPTVKREADMSGGLIIEGGDEVRISNVHFDLKSDSTPYGHLFAAVLVKAGVKKVVFENCILSQQAPMKEDLLEKRKTLKPLASVAVSNPGKTFWTEPRVEFHECLFEQGQTAVALNGTADIASTNCAFGPHAALFHLFGENKGFDSQLSLSQCSALVAHGPVLRLDDQARCEFIANKSLFSRPLPPPGEGRVGDGNTNLIHQADQDGPLVQFSGSKNCYNDLNALWVRRKGEKVSGICNSLVEFKKQLKESELGTDENSVFLKDKNALLEAEPLKILAGDPKLAFQLNPEIPELEVIGPELGVQKCVWGNTYSASYWKAAPPVAVVAPELIVDTDPEKPLAAGQFRTLVAAIAEVQKDGTEILIKHNGKLPVQSVWINQASKKITIKPFKGFRPVLTLDSEASSPEAALFEIKQGQVTFEDLAFRLEPDRKGFTAQSLVLLSSAGHCVFKNCLLTFKSSEKFPAALNAVTFAGASPNGDAKAPLPRIELEDSLVRGDGVFLNFDKASPYELDVRNSLVMLSDCVIKVHINYPIKAVMPGISKINLVRSTIHTQRHLIQLTDEDNGMGLISTSVAATDCLFAADASAMPLVEFVGSTNPGKRDSLFSWSGTHNAYCGFDTYLSQPQTTTSSPVEIKVSGWSMKESTAMGTDDSQKTKFFDKTLDFNLIDYRPLSDILPEDVQKMMNDLHTQLNDKKPGVTLNFGVNLGQLNDLPLVAPPAKLDPTEPDELDTQEP
jgi:serine/threonine protein kinase